MSDRRERYARALYKAVWPAGKWEICDHAYWYELADAIDDELRTRDEYWRGRFADKIASVENRCDEIIRENASLRDELERERRRAEVYVAAYDKFSRMDFEKTQAISRVRAVVDQYPEHPWYHGPSIRAALDGTDD